MRIWKITTAVAAIVVASAVGLHFNGKLAFLDNLMNKPAGAAAPPAMQAMPVPVTSVVKRTLPVYLEYTARTEAIRSITLQAKATGYMLEHSAEDGADVKKGDLLYNIDPRDYRAAVDQVKAQLQRDIAALDYAKGNLARGADLVKTGALTKDLYDQRLSAVQQGEATITADKAAIAAAEINLGYTEIRAPFDGRLGRNQAPVGTLVSVGGTNLNTLVQLAPMYVTFNPSETDLAELQKARAAGKIEAEISVPGENKARYKGDLTFLDNSVDPMTGTIAARATIANAERTLLPGQYVHIRLFLREEPDVLMAPQVALGSSQLGKYVYVVNDQSRVEQRFVSIGATHGDQVAILKGVAEGDQIIDGNLQKIGPGAPVKPIPKQQAKL